MSSNRKQINSAHRFTFVQLSMYCQLIHMTVWYFPTRFFSFHSRQSYISSPLSQRLCESVLDAKTLSDITQKRSRDLLVYYTSRETSNLIIINELNSHSSEDSEKCFFVRKPSRFKEIVSQKREKCEEKGSSVGSASWIYENHKISPSSNLNVLFL